MLTKKLHVSVELVGCCHGSSQWWRPPHFPCMIISLKLLAQKHTGQFWECCTITDEAIFPQYTLMCTLDAYDCLLCVPNLFKMLDICCPTYICCFHCRNTENTLLSLFYFLNINMPPWGSLAVIVLSSFPIYRWRTAKLSFFLFCKDFPQVT